MRKTQLEQLATLKKMLLELRAKLGKPLYLWATKAQARKSVELICDEEGLKPKEKALICAVIQAESGFNPLAQRQNTDKRKSIDYGICQYNSYWYIGIGKPIENVPEALYNPEKCVRVMIKQYKKGRLKDWVAYSSGAYKKYL